MKPQHTLLQKSVSPELTILFEEVNTNHPDIISNGSNFAIVIEDWEKGIYRFVNSIKEENKISNTHFIPNSAKPIKTMHDLNNLWKILTGKQLNYVGKRVEKVIEGNSYPTKLGGNLTVIEKVDGNKSKVRFTNGYETISQNNNIIRGLVRNPYQPLLFNVGYIGEGKYKSDTEVYRRWKSMLQRCYCTKTQIKQPAYIGCTVTEEWHCLQTFGSWYEDNYSKETMQAWALDKDILVNGNKIYSPDTCCFVPQEINNILVKSEGVNDKNPTGVVKKRAKYYVCFFKGGEIFHSRAFDTKEEASELYIFEKEKYIKELAEKYKNTLTPTVYVALVQYKTPTSNSY